MWKLIACLIAAGCGKGASAERDACKHMVELCPDNKDLARCADQLTDLRKQLGAQAADKYIACTRAAKSCTDVLGCATGLLDKGIEEMDKGLDKLRETDKPQPPECAQASELCEAAEPLARDQCRALIGTLDAERRTKLVACYGAAKSCAEFKKCTSENR